MHKFNYIFIFELHLVGNLITNVKEITSILWHCNTHTHTYTNIYIYIYIYIYITQTGRGAHPAPVKWVPGLSRG